MTSRLRPSPHLQQYQSQQEQQQQQQQQQQQPLLDVNDESMEEITLTGGTLLSNNKTNSNTAANKDPLEHKHSHNHGHANHHQQQQQQQQTPNNSNSNSNKNSMLPQLEALNNYHQLVTASAAGGGHHSHSHQHGGCCNSPGQHMPMPILQFKIKPEDMVLTQSTEEILQVLKVLTKMGQYSLLQEITQAWSASKGMEWLENTLREKESKQDSEGHTLLHWAAKRTDEIRFVQFWSKYIPLAVPTTDSTGMTPLHWSCTEPDSFAIIQFLVTQDPKLLEIRDASGCTPLLLAAQHGHVDTVAFLVHQFQANLNAVDDNGDSATHWAAYKGSQAVLGLLAYYEQENESNMLRKTDAYGQTPLHLAALRGHSACCQYILQHIAGPRNEHKRDAIQLLQLPDKNGRTPYQLAVHKKKPHTAACLQQAERTLSVLGHRPKTRGEVRLWLQTIFVHWLCSVHRWKTWFGIPIGQDDPMDVAPAFPNYYVIFMSAVNVWYNYTVFVPLFDLGAGVLWDCTAWHLMQFFLTVACIYTLYKTQTTNPGRLDNSCPEIGYWRRLYGETLANYANPEAAPLATKQMQLCHTCHIARPTRSKHDRHSGVCVLLFDHCCPFVGNTVGLYNYKWFYLLCVSLTWYFANHLVLLFKYVIRQKGSTGWFTLLLGLFSGAHILFAGTMVVYHTQLILANLTTNEHINMQKYEYLWTTGNPRKFKNPWFKGWWGNIMDRFQPSHQCYMLPEQQETLLSSSSSNNGDGGLHKGLEMV